MNNINQYVRIWKNKIVLHFIPITVVFLLFLLLLIRAIGYRRDFYICEKKYEELRNDWEGRNRYKYNIPNFKPDVVFIGASEIELWDLDRYFSPEFKVVNRGIGEQISAQILLRFYQDVINLNPKVVVISSGSNDIRNRVPLNVTIEYITRMIRIAKENNIKIVLATVTPVNDTQKGMLKIRPPQKIVALNSELKRLAKEFKIKLCDFWSILANKDGLLPKELSYDGVHLNEKGYKLISELIKPIIRELLSDEKR